MRVLYLIIMKKSSISISAIGGLSTKKALLMEGEEDENYGKNQKNQNKDQANLVG